VKKLLPWGLIAVLVIMGLGSVVRSYYVLDSQKLEAAIRMELPPGTPKANAKEYLTFL
jgi:1,4-dihydroxy-2-naphthoate octaprenyltransferase